MYILRAPRDAVSNSGGARGRGEVGNRKSVNNIENTSRVAPYGGGSLLTRGGD